jgi:hypothetical protein
LSNLKNPVSIKLEEVSFMTESKTNNQPQFFEFLRYLQANLGELTDNQHNSYTEEEKWRLGRLGNAAETLASFAEEIGDKELCSIADDFIYTVNKTSMGSSFKVQSEIAKFDYKLNNYEKKANRSNRSGSRLWNIE